jgi:hypothetical protein
MQERPFVTDSQPPRATPTLRLAIELNETVARRSHDMMPTVRLTVCDGGDQCIIGEIRTDEKTPRIAAADGAFALADAPSILSRVMDEGAWLAELRRVLAPGGQLRLTVPAGGPLAWLDAHNIYRYLTDITGRGTKPSATLPTGWHRHYHADEIRHLVEHAGFTVRGIERTGVGLAEIPQLMGLVVGDYLLKRPDTEHRMHPNRARLERLDREIQVPGIGKVYDVLATRP